MSRLMYIKMRQVSHYIEYCMLNEIVLVPMIFPKILVHNAVYSSSNVLLNLGL